MAVKKDLSPGLAAATLLLLGATAWGVFSHFPREADRPAAGVAQSSATTPAPLPADWDEQRLLELTGSDPLRAIRLSQQLANAAERERILTAALEFLKRSNPALAAEIVAALPAGDFQQVAAGQVATAFAQVDAGAAWRWARTLADDATRLRAVRDVAAAWAESDPRGAAASVASLGSERERQLGALAVATVWTRRDPAASLAWAETMQPLDARVLVSGSAVQTCAESDAVAAMDWLARQPPEVHAAMDPNTRFAILGKWAAQDPGAAREFVRGMTPGKEQAQAVAIVTVHLAKKDPLATMEWALTLPQESVQNAAFSTAFRQWSEVAPQLAEAWLKAADLSAEEKLRLVNYP